MILKKIVRCAEDIRVQNESWKKYFKGTNVLLVPYEDMIKQPVETFVKISNFIDPDCTVSPSLPERTERQGNNISQEWRERFILDANSDYDWVIKPQEFLV